MSDTQGERPDESPAASASEAVPGAPTTPAAPTASSPADARPQAPHYPAAPPVPSSATPQSPAPQSPAPGHGGWQAPAGHGAPAQGAPGQGYAGQGYGGYAAPQPPAYGAPARQPQPHPYAGAHPGQPGQPGQPQAGYPSYAGTAFGQAAASSHQPTQPTLPLGASAGGSGGDGRGPATGTTTTADAAPRRKTGAPAVVGLIVAAALVGGAAGLGGAYAGANLWSTSAAAPAAGPQTVTVNDTDSVNATTAIAAKVTPSVVTIQASAGNSGGTGSGVVLTSDGYIATNTHVVTLDGAAGNATLRVTTSDGRVFDAELVGTDPTYDLAVIKLKDASGLTPIDFADSSKLNVGDQTVAIGAPLGLSNTVTTGIVSALNRSIQIASSAAPDSGESQDGGQGNGESPFQFDIPGQGTQQQATSSISIAVIQTDAAINPGNSGGALVDSEGKLIGINVAIASAGGNSSGGQSGSIGVGFSIPSDVVKRVTDEIIANGSATHGLLGASVQAAASVEGATITGAYIQDVTAGGAAAQGGLKKGDIVTSFNGVPITDSVDLTAQVRAAAAGSTATVTYVRNGKTLTTDVTLGTLQQ